MKKETTPTYEPWAKIAGTAIMAVAIFIPFTFLIVFGDPELFLTIVFFAIPTILSIYIFRGATSVITAIIMIIFTLYLK